MCAYLVWRLVILPEIEKFIKLQLEKNKEILIFLEYISKQTNDNKLLLLDLFRKNRRTPPFLLLLLMLLRKLSV